MSRSRNSAVYSVCPLCQQPALRETGFARGFVQTVTSRQCTGGPSRQNPDRTLTLRARAALLDSGPIPAFNGGAPAGARCR
jgi:hypothetical protein